MNVAVSVIQLLDVKLVENADAESFEETWGVNCVVSNPFYVTDLIQFCEVDAAGVVLIWPLHNIYNKKPNQSYIRFYVFYKLTEEGVYIIN